MSGGDVASQQSGDPEELQRARVLGRLLEKISDVIDQYVPEDVGVTVGLPPTRRLDLQGQIQLAAFKDLQALVEKDPAALGKTNYALEAYESFKVVLHYRIAHAILVSDMQPEFRVLVARQISDRAKSATTMEIQPGAEIGERFVLDHGAGTVIGDTAVIGHDCYVLQGVVLGASGVAGNRPGRRHPHIGNSVEIAGFAKLLGSIRVGSNVFIGPSCIVTADVPSNSRVVIVNQLQIQRPAASSPAIEIFGVVPCGLGCVRIYGSGLQGVEVTVCRKEGLEASFIGCTATGAQDDHVDVKISQKEAAPVSFLNDVVLQLSKDHTVIHLVAARGLRKVLDALSLTWRSEEEQ